MRSLGGTFVGLFAAKVLTVIGIVALFLGFVLTIAGMETMWLAWSGAALSVMAVAALFLATRLMQTELERMSDTNITTIYMPLLNEGTEVWRPVEAMKITDLGYMVTETPLPNEEWAFQPGHVLRCEDRQVSGEMRVVAVAKAT